MGGSAAAGFKKKRVFITGASGFLGQHLTQKLAPQYDILALARPTLHKVHSQNSSLSIIEGSLESTKSWQDALKNIDIVIHLAAITHTKNAKEYFDINTEGTRKLLVACERNSIKKFIFVSTRAIGDLCGPYGASKEKAEEYIRTSTLPYIILRVAETYDDLFSSREGIGTIGYFAKKSLIIPYIPSKSIKLAPIHIDDVLTAVEKAVNLPFKNKTYTVAGPENLTMREVVKRICVKGHLKRVLMPLPPFFVKALSLAGMAYPDQYARLKCPKESLSVSFIQDFGFKPREFLVATKT